MQLPFVDEEKNSVRFYFKDFEVFELHAHGCRLNDFLFFFLGKISLFFFVYYACLAGFFATMFAIAFSTLPDIKDGPKHTMFIEDRPGTELLCTFLKV